jgi:hypothetical protein
VLIGSTSHSAEHRMGEEVGGGPGRMLRQFNQRIPGYR